MRRFFAALMLAAVLGIKPATAAFDMSQIFAYPVPFQRSSSASKITFASLPTSGKIAVYSVDGRLVRSILFQDPADGKMTWDAKNDSGEDVASDVYVWRVSSPDGEKIGKLVILR